LQDDHKHILTKAGETTFSFIVQNAKDIYYLKPVLKRKKTQVPQKFSTILFLHPSTMRREQTSMQPLSLLRSKACVEESLTKT
jgi:hypothetical protein